MHRVLNYAPAALLLQACLDFVRREYPQYLEAYRRLDKPVERSDLFR